MNHPAPTDQYTRKRIRCCQSPLELTDDIRRPPPPAQPDGSKRENGFGTMSARTRSTDCPGESENRSVAGTLARTAPPAHTLGWRNDAVGKRTTIPVMRPHGGVGADPARYHRFCESAGVRFPRATLLICAFEKDSDARHFQEVLLKRLARFSLELAEEKTQLLRFGRFARRDCQRHDEGAPGTFDFLGFTHYCGQSRAKRYKLKRRTAKKKYKAKLRELKNWFHTHLTTPLSEAWATLNAKLRGHYQYYGINDNWPWLMKFRGAAKKLAYRWLNRRSQSKSKNWRQFYAYMDRFPLASPTKLTDLIAMARSR